MTQPKDFQTEIKAQFNQQEIKLLKVYIDFYKIHYPVIRYEVFELLDKHPLWGPIFKCQTKEEKKIEGERTFKLERSAVYDDKWDEYIQHLIQQGNTFAALNVSYYDWYELVKMFKNHLTLHIRKDIENDPQKLLDIQSGLTIFTDFAMYVIAEAYFIAKNKSLNEYIHFFENSYDLACIAKTDGYFKMVNPAFIKNLGYTEYELLSQPFANFIHEEDLKATYQEVEKLSKGGLTVNFVNRYRKKNGNYIWLQWTAIPNVSTGDLYCSARDITLTKVAEEKLKLTNENLQIKAIALEKSNNELEQFMYIASHDLQEPLRMVTSFLTLLESKYEGIIDEQGKKYIHFAVEGAKRMRKLILDLLAYAKTSNIETTSLETNTEALVKDIEILLSQKISESKAIIKYNQLPVIRTDEVILRQVFQNLIGNGLKYHDKNVVPEIIISYEEKPDSWLFMVKDNGIGINEMYFNQIFIVFKRLHDKNEYSGTGMGLAITKKMVESLGGKIWVESEIGKGSVFYFTVLKK